MRLTTVTSAKTPAKSVALQHLEPDDLHGQLQDSLTQLSILGRKISAEIRIRLFPMLQEVKRRYDSGETVNKVKGYHEYLRSIGLNPSTVRTWELRHKKKHSMLDMYLDDADEIDLPNISYVEKQTEKYEQKLQNDIEFAAADAQREVTEDDETFLHDFARRAKEAKERSPFADYRAPKPTAVLPVGRPSSTDIQEFISLGRRAAAAKYHPDHGGDAERMARMNQVADWLERLTVD